MPSKGKQSDHRVCITGAEFALMCYLRLNPGVAATYGIKDCNGMTTIGSMLKQTLLPRVRERVLKYDAKDRYPYWEHKETKESKWVEDDEVAAINAMVDALKAQG